MRGIVEFVRCSVIGAGVVVLAASVVAACGGGSSSSAPTPGSTSGTTTTTVPLGSGPSTATLALAGDKALTGALTSTSIACSFPSLDGPLITVLSNTVAAGVATFMFVSPTGVRIRVTSGSGTSFLQREFVGAGVTHYDGARGAHVDSALHESAAATGASKTLPAATSVKGDIACGGQRPGSSTIVLRGDTSGGPMNATLDSVRVTCTPTASGKFVTAVGIVKVGTTRAVVFVDGQPRGMQVYVEPANVAALVFTSSDPAVATTTSTGMHVAGDVVQSGATGQAPHTLHISGDAVCGATGAK